MNNPSYLLGIDLGTSGVKSLLIQDTGGIVASATQEYPLSTPRPNWSEQSPEAWWRATARSIKEVLARAAIAPGRVTALAISGQMHGAVLLDAMGKVLRPAILWNDGRSGPQCAEITERAGGLESLLAMVANPALAGFTAPKLLWVRQNEPAVFERAQTVLLPKDYINYRLTGRLATEVSDASGTLLFDVQNRRWSDDMLRALDLPAHLVPPCLESIEVVGELTPAAARSTGLKAGLRVVAGGADNACAAVGTGVVSPGQALSSIGTSGTIVVPTTTGDPAPQGRAHVFCHAVPGVYYVMGVMLSAGGALRWYRDTLGQDEVRRAAAEGVDPYEVMAREAATVAPGCEGLVFLPYLAGERTPHADPDARGVFFGLSLRHSKAHLTRAVLEGVTFGLRDSLEIVRGLGLTVDRIRATGGGARSALWRSLQADVFDAEVATVNTSEGPAYGAALLAGAGVGVFPSVEAATTRTIREVHTVAPDPQRSAAYAGSYALYRALYPQLREQFAAAAALVGARR
ncbi:MAG: xylulokinase [Chloroflexota bacterium]